MILKKIFINKTKVFLHFVFLLLMQKALFAKEHNYTNKSYLGSLLAAQIAKYNNDNIIAADFYDFASKKNPKNAEILNMSLMSFILAGKVDLALDKLNNKDNLQGLKTSQVHQLLKFVSLIKKSKFSDAKILFKKNEDILLTGKLKYIMLAWLADDYEEARKIIDEYPYKTPELNLSSIYFYHLAYLNSYYDNKKDSLKIFKDSLKNSQDSKVRGFYFYYNFINKFKYTDNKIINNFTTNNPDHSLNIYINKNIFEGFSLEKRVDGISEIFFNIAENLYSQGMHDSSIAYSYLSLFLNKNNYINYYLIAQNYQILGKNSKAIEILKYIPLNNYLGWNTYIKIVDLYTSVGDYNNAEQYIKSLEKFGPKRSDFYYKSGEFYHNKKQYIKAITNFSNAISLLNKPEKKDWYLFYSRGMTYERSKNWNKAEKDFLYALKLFPDQPLVLNYLGYSWIDFKKNLKEAESLILKAVKLRPNDGYFIDSLGWTYYRKGNYKKAVESLEKAVSLVPSDPIINDHLGDALWKAGYKNEAIFQWNRALLYSPENEIKKTIKLKLQKGL